MAFTSILWNGIGVIADCNSLTDAQGGTWAELGGGGISANTDNPLVPPASIGHVYASKSGYGYYTTPATYNFGSGGNAEGQYIYIMIQIQSVSAFDTYANNGFSFVVGTDTNNHKYYQLASSEIGGGELFDGGGWKLFVIDPTIIGSIADKGTFDITTINMIGLWMDTIVSVRADTIFIGSVAIGSGIKVTGTGTLQEIVDYCTDYSLRSWPVFRKEGRSIFTYGSLTAGDNATATIDTFLTDNGKSNEFRYTKFWDGTAYSLSHPSTYNKMIFEKHASYLTDYTSLNTGLLSNIDAKLSRIIETGATIDSSGGSLDIMSSFNTISGEVTQDKVLNGIDATSLSNTPDNCTWNNSGLITIELGGGLENSTINTPTAPSSLLCSDIVTLNDNIFNSDGSNHAIELTSLGGGSMNWNNYLNGYSNVDGSTGNEAIFVNVGTGTLSINVGTGYTIPYIRTAGAAVTVVSGQVTTTITVKNQSGDPIVGARVYAVTESTIAYPTPPLIDGTLIFNTLTDVNGQVSDTRSLGSSQPIIGWARDSTPPAPYYKQTPISEVIDNGNGLNLNMLLILD